MSRGRLRWAIPLLALAASCGPDQPPAGTPTAAPQSLDRLELARPYLAPEPQGPPRPGLAEYRAAADAADANDLPRTIAELERAVALDPDFAEAWYQLGAARSRLAVDEVDLDEAHAVTLFRDAVDAKRRARSLLLLGRATLWSDDERRRSEADLVEALRDVDEILANDETVALGLRAYRAAGQPRF